MFAFQPFLFAVSLFLASPMLSSSLSLMKGNKLTCTEEGKAMQFSFLQKDPCITCLCKNGTIDCFKKLNCKTDQNVLQRSESAPNPVNAYKRCFSNGRVYQNTEKWFESCRECTCTNGQVKCLAVKAACSKPITCPVGEELRKHSTDCCPRCVPATLSTSPNGHSLNRIAYSAHNSHRKHSSISNTNISKQKSAVYGVCGLNKNNQVRTFDGRDYLLRGKCSYVLARDCSGETPSFAVNLVQKYPYPHHRHLAVRIRFQDKVIFLSHLGRVRINKDLIKLPHMEFGRFFIVRKNEEIHFKATLGFEIRYAINKTVEIKVEEAFSNKLCGLCGNYNGQVYDDFQEKHSKSIVSLDRFLYSFKVGQTQFCPRGQRFKSTTHKIKSQKHSRISNTQSNDKRKKMRRRLQMKTRQILKLQKVEQQTK